MKKVEDIVTVTVWRSMDLAPRDTPVLCWCPGAPHDLPDLYCEVLYHEEAGWTCDELRHPELWTYPPSKGKK